MSRCLDVHTILLFLNEPGAEVIKVESMGGDDTRKWGPPFANGGESAYFISLNRNKLSITVDMKHPASKRIIDQLILRSDVLIENFISGTAEKLGVGYEEVSKKNERIIYCSVTGFGTTGVYAKKPGYDAICRCYTGRVLTLCCAVLCHVVIKLGLLALPESTCVVCMWVHDMRTSFSCLLLHPCCLPLTLR